jgi:hypothetical protein
LKITDEWGIYDPAKAGMPALFARLGRPILRAAPTSARKERRRALRPERSSEGVGLAIAEVLKRVALNSAGGESPEIPIAGGNPARAMRLALRAQAAVNAIGTPAAEPFVAPPQPPPPVAVAPAPEAVTPAPAERRPKSRTRKKVATRSAAAAEQPTRRARPRKSAGKASALQAAAVEEPASSRALTATAPEPAAGPPAPSPRRPRGPVPLAAWAHAVVDDPAPAPRRVDKRGFWRGLFRIPTEVALVEYAHGAKIHRLLIEAGDDQLPDFI